MVQSLRQALHEALSQDRGAFSRTVRLTFRRRRHTLTAGNFLQQPAIDIHQHPERGLAVFIDDTESIRAGAVVLARAVSLMASNRAARWVLPGGTPPAESRISPDLLGGKIHAAHGGVFLHITNNVGELEGQAAMLRQRFGRGIAISEYADADQAHDRGYPVAI